MAWIRTTHRRLPHVLIARYPASEQRSPEAVRPLVAAVASARPNRRAGRHLFIWLVSGVFREAPSFRCPPPFSEVADPAVPPPLMLATAVTGSGLMIIITGSPAFLASRCLDPGRQVRCFRRARRRLLIRAGTAGADCWSAIICDCGVGLILDCAAAGRARNSVIPVVTGNARSERTRGLRFSARV
jgi:hypothetical protein